jgi:nitrogen fixation protein
MNYFYSILYDIINITMSKDEFEAADVFILHNHIRHGLCVVLFQDANRRTRDHVTMPGGMWDDHSDLPEVAEAELFEESLKSIKADLAIFKTMDASNMFVDIRGIHGGNKQRRVYFCYMPYIVTQKYYKNKSLLKYASREYRETEHIIFIRIKDIINRIIKMHTRSKEMHETKIMDVTERVVNVHGITMNALYTFLNKKNLLDQLLSLNQSLSAGGGRNFFNNWRRWFPRAPQTSKVSITTGSPVLPPSFHRTDRGDHSPRPRQPPSSRGTQRAPSSRETQRVPSSPRTRRGNHSPRTYRGDHSRGTYRVPSSPRPLDPLEPIINAMVQQAVQQQSIYVLKNYYNETNKDNTTTIHYII